MCSSLACGYRRGPRETEVESARQDRMTERQEARAAGLQRGAGGSQRSRPGAPAWSSRRGPDDRGRGGWAGGGYGRGAAGSGGPESRSGCRSRSGAPRRGRRRTGAECRGSQPPSRIRAEPVTRLCEHPRALAGGRGRRTCSWVTASTDVRKSAL